MRLLGIIILGIMAFVGLVKGIGLLIKFLDKKHKRASKQDNPYINAHRVKMTNDKMYDEYLEWLDKVGGDVPFEKWKFDEELRAESKIDKLF